MQNKSSLIIVNNINITLLLFSESSFAIVNKIGINSMQIAFENSCT